MTTYATATTTAGMQAQVMRGDAALTCPGGLTKKDLRRNKSGQVVSRRKSRASKKRYQRSPLKMWNAANAQAVKVLKLPKYKVATKASPKLYATTKNIYKSM